MSVRSLLPALLPMVLAAAACTPAGSASTPPATAPVPGTMVAAEQVDASTVTVEAAGTTTATSTTVATRASSTASTTSRSTSATSTSATSTSATSTSATSTMIAAGADGLSLAEPPPAVAVTGRSGTALVPPTASTADCAAEPARGARLVPPALAAVIAARLADPGFAGSVLGASIWVEGFGEVVSEHPEAQLLPASNQKLLTAVGVLEVLPSAARLSTVVVATGPVVGGVVQGNLILVGGGDPTLTTHGDHSLATLVDQLLVAGVRGVNGAIVADESRYPVQRLAPGWEDGNVPSDAGPLSALMVDDNRYRWDEAYAADPALGNAAQFRAVLAGAGIAVNGPNWTGTVPAGATVLATMASPTVAELVDEMLLDSDNETAELLTREAGLVGAGEGTTAAGTRVLAAALDRLCVHLAAGWSDGSGLSRTDRRSARELRALVQAAVADDSWPIIKAGLPVAGRSGTLINRFVGTPAEGVVSAKTGYLNDARALSGVFTTRGGRRVVFSILVNGATAPDSVSAIDELVSALAGDAS